MEGFGYVRNYNVCKHCGGHTKPYDRVKRILKMKGGNKRYIWVQRYQCPDCGKIHRVLPDYILPYKQYDAEIIRGVIEGIITPDTYGYEDYPCDKTMERWMNVGDRLMSVN